jgi:UDP-N-acetylmuramoyl-tripeptide--D-alanyl-D-alanine ligase
LPNDGVAVFPADSEFSALWRKAAANRKFIDFVLSTTEKAAVTGRLLSNGHVEIRTAAGVIEIQLKTLGSHNVRNALAASAVALAANIPLDKIKAGLESFDPVNGRMQAKPLDANCTVIDDSYNANPDSARAAIDALAQSESPAWFVLGDMGEVGDQGPAFHYEIGAYAAEQGIEKFFAIGEQCQQAVRGFEELKRSRQLSSSAEHFSEIDQLNAQLVSDLLLRQKTNGKHLNILIKGSRFMRMERVVQALLEGAKVCS